MLLVDDEPQVLVALDDILGDDFIVLKTESAEDAVRVVKNTDDIAVVVSDERMPHMAGSELFACLREMSDARRILVTGFADLEAVVRAVNDGKIFAYVTKPWQAEDLKQKVQQAAEQYRLIRNLANERQLLKDLMVSAPDGIYFMDRRLRIRSANQAFADLIGIADAASLIGKTIGEVHPDWLHLAATREEDSAILSGGQPCLDVVRNYSGRWVSETKAPIHRQDGRVVGIVGIARDVTDRVHLSEDLRESEQRLRRQSSLLEAILNSMRESVIAADADGRVLISNLKAQQMFGGALQQSALEWARQSGPKRPDTSEALADEENPLLRAAQGSELREVEVEIPSAEPRDATWAVTGAPLQDIDGNRLGGLVLLRDVTEKRLLMRQLAQAQKMEAIGLLAGGVAHDFNNLLSIIMAYTQFVQHRLPKDDPSQSDIEQVLAGAERAARLTRQLLAVSRNDPREPRPLLINEAVTNLEYMLRRVIGETISLTTELASDLPPIIADVGQLEQVLLNLAVNARDAMPKGGELAFTTQYVDVATPLRLPSVQLPAGRYVRLGVSDTGIGMSPEVQRRIFEPFFTTKGVGEGTGLGLATVYGIVQQAGGYIDVVSEPGRGTCFSIYLPEAEVGKAQSSLRPSSRPPRSRATANVLLVEDDDAVRRATSRILRAQGHTVVECGAPSQALRLAASKGAEVDLLVTDMVLPEMTGVELAQHLSERFGEMKMLFMSGYPGKVQAESIRKGASFMQKPLSVESLTRAVAALLEPELVELGPPDEQRRADRR